MNRNRAPSLSLFRAPARTLFHIALAPALLTTVLIAGCSGFGGGAKSSDTAATPAPATTAAAPAAPAKPKVAAGFNANGEVIDSSKVEAGSGQKVKGLNDWEGEITGKPAPGTNFTKLQIGMSMKQVTDIVGEPTDKGAYVTGKAWIPFYFGSDRHRFEMVFKGRGRLIFAGGSLGDFTGGNLIWIIHNATEGGYR